MTSLAVVLSIFVAIFLGYRTKINTGVFAMAFAYLIGCFMLDMSSKDVIKTWPISIFFVIMSVSLFYNFALVNGTLEKIAMILLYKCRKFQAFLPLIVYFAATIVAGLGAGFFTVMAFFTPITLLLCEKTKMNKLVGAVAVNYGALAGANFMVSASGIVFRSLMSEVGMGAESFQYTTNIFLTTFIIPIVVISLLIFFVKKEHSERVTHEMEKPEPFTQKQKQNLFLIMSMMAVVLIIPILTILLKENTIIASVNKKIDIGLVAMVFSVIAFLLNLADQHQVIAKVPWNTLIMICGVGMLIQVAIQAGTIDLLSGWIGKSNNTFIVPFLLAIIGAFMSFFSSTIGVVCPAIFPIIPSIAQATQISPSVLFVALTVGAQASAISPFSSGGSLVLGSISKEEERTDMFTKLLFQAVPMCMAAALAATFILTLFLR